MKYLHLTRAVFAVLLVFATFAYGQAVTASLLGNVADASGAAVPNAKLTITEVNTGISRGTTSNESGLYVFSNLAPGTYTVRAEQTGFKRAERTGIDVIVNTTTRIDLTLQPGQITETINVTSEAPPLQTERADTGRQIETKTIEDLPCPPTTISRA